MTRPGPTEAECAEARVRAAAMLADLRAKVAAAPAGIEAHPDAAVGLVSAVANVADVLRQAGGVVPHDLVTAEYAIRRGLAFALEALRDAAPDPAPRPPPAVDEAEAAAWSERFRSACAESRTRTMDEAALVAVEDVTWPILARGYADAAGVPLRDVAPDVAADLDAIEAAVRSNRARRRLDALGSDRDVNARTA